MTDSILPLYNSTSVIDVEGNGKKLTGNYSVDHKTKVSSVVIYRLR